jgi:hypothetical protein
MSWLTHAIQAALSLLILLFQWTNLYILCNIKSFTFTSSLWRGKSIIHSIIHLVVSLMMGPVPLPKWALRIVQSGASSFKWEYPLLSLRSSSSFLHLLPCLPVTSLPPFNLSFNKCCRRQFLHKMWPIQFVFHLLISNRIFLCSLTPSNIIILV